MRRQVSLGGGTPTVCRLGLATRGNTALSAIAVRHAIDRGIGYLNWCGHRDGMAEAISELSPEEREKIVVATQIDARSGEGAKKEIDEQLRALGTEYIDVVTFYYVERADEWTEIRGSGGALEALRSDSRVRRLGLTTHQRELAKTISDERTLDLLMIRYNAAHRGAERALFAATQRNDTRVVAFTCTRWGKLMQPTPEDPGDFTVPSAREWYRFALAHPAVDIALMAPNGRDELDHNLSLLEDWRAPQDIEALRAHGDRVYAHAGRFP